MIIKLIKIINKLFLYSNNVIIKEPYISYNDNSVIDVITIVRIESYYDTKEYILPFNYSSLLNIVL